METKQCSKCGEIKPRTAFYESKGKLRAACIPCVRAQYQANAEASQQQKREYRAANPDVVKAQRQKHYQRHGEKVREKARAYSKANAEQRRAYAKRYSESNRDRLHEYLRNRHKSNPVAAIVRVRIWRQANRERARALRVAQNHRRRARIAGNGGAYTTAEWKTLCEQYGNRCLACGSEGPLTVDHLVPVSKGGSNDISNLQPLCLVCNDRKGTQVIDYRPTYFEVCSGDGSHYAKAA